MNLGNYMITISLLLVIVVIQLIMNGLMKKKRFKKHVTKSNFHSSDKLDNVKNTITVSVCLAVQAIVVIV